MWVHSVHNLATFRTLPGHEHNQKGHWKASMGTIGSYAATVCSWWSLADGYHRAFCHMKTEFMCMGRYFCMTLCALGWLQRSRFLFNTSQLECLKLLAQHCRVAIYVDSVQDSYTRRGFPAMTRLTESQRLRIVHLAAESYSVASIARRVGCSVKTVRFWIHRYRLSGSAKSMKATGRQCLLSSNARKRALDLLLQGTNGGARFVARQLHSEGLTGRVVAPGTVLRAAKAQAEEDGDPLICRRGRPPKQLTGVNRNERVAFANINKTRCWSRVMFTDRCKFHFRYPGCSVRSVRWLRRSKKHDDGAFRPNHPAVYNVYGGLTRFGTTKLHPVTGTTGQKIKFNNLKGEPAKNITRAEYSDVLQTTLLREGQRIFSQQGMMIWVLQQDGDPTHARAAEVIHRQNAKLRGSRVSLLPSWPGNSPDLSPIENVWAYVDAEVAKLGCKSFEEFKSAVDVTFQSVPKKMCQHLFASVPKRLARCVEYGGAKTGY